MVGATKVLRRRASGGGQRRALRRDFCSDRWCDVSLPVAVFFFFFFFFFSGFCSHFFRVPFSFSRPKKYMYFFASIARVVQMVLYALGVTEYGGPVVLVSLNYR